MLPSRVSHELDDAARVLDGHCAALGVPIPTGALDELRELRHVLGSDGTAALTPADTCPDNNVLVGDRVVLIDFEGAQWRHVAWDVAYLFVPWPSCWCAWSIPDELAARPSPTTATRRPRAAGRRRRALRAGGTGSDRRLGAPSTTWFLDWRWATTRRSTPSAPPRPAGR